MKIVAAIGVSLLAIALVAALVRHNFIVVDGFVTKWQIEPVMSRGVIQNDREYRAVLYYVEQIFTSGGFDKPESRALVDQLNHLLAAYHVSKGQAPQPPQGGA